MREWRDDWMSDEQMNCFNLNPFL